MERAFQICMTQSSSTGYLSQEEAGRYLETFKAYEHKPPDIIKERVDPDYLSKVSPTMAAANLRSSC